MNLVKLKHITLAAGLAALSAGPALANPTFYREGTTIFGVGITPGDTVDINYSKVAASAIRAGQCGEVIIRNAVSDIKVDGVDIAVANLPQLLLPPCTNGTFAEARPNNFKTFDDRVVIVGKSPGSFSTVFSDATRRLRANSCGFVTARPSNTYQQTANTIIKIGAAAPAAISTLPERGAPICRTNSTTQVSTPYYPPDWLTTP